LERLPLLVRKKQLNCNIINIYLKMLNYTKNYLSIFFKLDIKKCPILYWATKYKTQNNNFLYFINILYITPKMVYQHYFVTKNKKNIYWFLYFLFKNLSLNYVWDARYFSQKLAMIYYILNIKWYIVINIYYYNYF